MMQIRRQEWMNDEDIVEEFLQQSARSSTSTGIEADVRNLMRNLTHILLQLDRTAVLNIVEAKEPEKMGVDVIKLAKKVGVDYDIRDGYKVRTFNFTAETLEKFVRVVVQSLPVKD